MILGQVLENLQVEVIGGGNLVSHRPIFTSDSKNLLIVSSEKVIVYNTTTGFCTSSLDLPLADSIANISTHSSGNRDDILLICTTLGKLLSMEVSTGQILETDDLKIGTHKPHLKPISNIINFLFVKKNYFLFVAYPQDSVKPVLYSASKKGDRGYWITPHCWNMLLGMHSIAAGCDDENGDVSYITALNEDSLFVHDVKLKQSKWHRTGSRHLTCVATHPRELIIATGDDTGRIVLWRNFMDRRPAQTVLHWHTLPVRDLAFSVEGTHLMSGGGESTMVKWDISNVQNKRTLPRLGLPIRHISVSKDNSLIAISHADNCIQLVDSTDKVTTAIQNVTQCYIPEGEGDVNISARSLGGTSVFQAGIHVDPNYDNLVLNGKPGHLQCYSFHEAKHLYKLDITQQNFITAERNKPIPNTDVTHVSFSSNGTWLGTSENREEDGKCTELRIKFWKFDKVKQRYILNTSVEWPHENSLHSLRIQPLENDRDNSLIACTAGGDRIFKTWGIVQDTSMHGKSEWWNCENIGSYRDLEAGPVAFSQDGSVLGAAFSKILTLWTVGSHELKGTLTHSYIQEEIKLLDFGQNQNSHLAICCTKGNLIIWDVITYTLMWSVPVQAECLAVDFLSNHVAIFSSKNHLYFFRPDDPKPLAIHKNVSRSSILSCAFVKNPEYSDFGDLKSTLVFINSSQELCILLPKDLVKKEQRGIEKPVEEKMTPFAEMIPEKKITGAKSEDPNVIRDFVGIPGASVIREIMEASPHTMPSISYFADQLLKSVSIRKDPSTELEERVQVMKRLEKTTPRKRLDSTGSNMEMDAQDEDQEVSIIGENFEKGLDSEEFDLDLVSEEDISWIKQCVSQLNFDK